MTSLLLGAALTLVINGEADLKSVRHNRVLKSQIQKLLKSSPPQLQALLKELGIEPLRHVDRVQVALRHYAGSQKEEPIVILHGRFSPKKFRKVWAATKQDTGLKETSILGKKAYEGKGRLPMFVVESDRKVLVGRRHDLEQAMKGRMNSKGLPKHMRQAHVWFRVQHTLDGRQIVGSQAKQDPIVDLVEFQLHASLKGAWLHGGVEVETTSETAAKELEVMLSHRFGALRQTLKKQLQVRVKKNRLSIALKMRVAEFVKLRLPVVPPAPPSAHVPGLAPDQPMSLPPDSALSP